MNPITRTRLKDTCLIPLHPHYNILSDILKRHQEALDSNITDNRLGRSLAFAKEGDIVLILYRTLDGYHNKLFHACRVRKDETGDLVIDGFNKTPGSYTLDYYSVSRVRILDGDLEPLKLLLVDHIAGPPPPEPLLPPPPSI